MFIVDRKVITYRTTNSLLFTVWHCTTETIRVFMAYKNYVEPDSKTQENEEPCVSS